MPDVQFLMRSAKRREARLPASRCLNLYAEAAPTSPNADVVLIPFPGLTVLRTFTGTVMRGLFQRDGVMNGDVFAVVDNRVIRNADTAPEEYADRLEDSTGRVKFAGDGDELMLVCSGKLYRAGTTLQRVLYYDDDESLIPPIVDIAYINGWFLYAFEGDEQYGWSRINDGDNLNALDFASAEYSPDGLVGLLVEREQISLFGSETVEAHVNTGDPDAPFERRPGGSFETGLIGPLAKCVADNSFVWVGADGIVYRMAESPKGISTPAEEEAIARCEEAGLGSEISLWTLTWRGHPFVIMDVPGEGSFVHDARTQMWGEVGSWEKELYRGFAQVKAGGKQIIADRYAPRLLVLDVEADLDPDGTPIEYLVTAHLRKVPRNTVVYSALLLGSKGLGGEGEDAPVAKLRTSIDGGAQWSTSRTSSLGAIGQRRVQTKWNKLGRVLDDGMLMEVSITDRVNGLRLDGMRVNE